MNTHLTSHQIALLKKSFRQFNTERVSARFYATLFEQHPQVKPMFPSDTVELGLKLMSVFELVVFSFDEKMHNQYALQDSLILPLRELGRTHDSKGVMPAHYEIAHRLLLQSMEGEGKEIFTEEVKQSWQLALDHLTYAMLNTSVDKSLKPVDQSGISMREAFAHIIQNLKKQISPSR